MVLLWGGWASLTKTCQTFSLAPSKLQKRTLAPNRPWPPHMLLGVTCSSLIRCVLELYTSSLTGFSTLAFKRSFSKSPSLFCRDRKIFVTLANTQKADLPKDVHSVQISNGIITEIIFRQQWQLNDCSHKMRCYWYFNTVLYFTYASIFPTFEI